MMMTQFDDLKQSSLDTAAAAKARIAESYGKAKVATSDAAAKGREQAHQLGEKLAPSVARGKKQAAKAGTKLKEVAETQPLALVAGAVALGALLGSLLPKRRPPEE
jgi:succinate dehydrogenase/fumarate reductase flavoprotein subunit